jgi:hypothetical protein
VARGSNTGPCCENHSYELEQHDETVELFSVKILKPELKLVALAYTFILPLLQEATADNLIPDLYRQPPIARDIPVPVQFFLLLFSFLPGCTWQAGMVCSWQNQLPLFLSCKK